MFKPHFCFFYQGQAKETKLTDKPLGLPVSRSIYKSCNKAEYKRKCLSKFRGLRTCLNVNCKEKCAPSAKHYWSCNQKLADECLPRSMTAIKRKLRNISKGIGAHDHDKKFHSLMVLIPNEVDNKSSYIFNPEHINQPKIHISSFPVDVVEQLHLQIFKESSKDIKKNLFWYKLFSNGSENNWCQQFGS